MVECPSCDTEVETIRLSGDRHYHVGEGACGNPVASDWVEEHKDEFVLETKNSDDDGSDSGSDSSDSAPDGDPPPRGGSARSGGQTGRPDRYSQRVQQKADRVVDWVRGGPVGVDPESETAEDFISRLQNRPDITENARTLQEWIESYFTQVPQPALEDLFRDLEAIDQQYERSGEMFSDLGVGEGGQQANQQGQEPIDEERLVELMYQVQNQQDRRQQEEDQEPNKLTEARNEVIDELGDNAAQRVGQAGETVEWARETFRDLIRQEMRENPEFRRWLFKEGVRNPLLAKLFARLGSEESPFDVEGLLESLEAGSSGGNSGGGGGPGGSPMGGAMGSMMGGGETESSPGPDPSERNRRARERAEKKADEREAPPPVTPDESGNQDTSESKPDAGTQAEPPSPPESPSSGTETDPMTASPHTDNGTAPQPDTGSDADSSDSGGDGQTETDSEEEVLEDFTDIA